MESIISKLGISCKNTPKKSYQNSQSFKKGADTPAPEAQEKKEGEAQNGTLSE